MDMTQLDLENFNEKISYRQILVVWYCKVHLMILETIS